MLFSKLEIASLILLSLLSLFSFSISLLYLTKLSEVFANSTNASTSSFDLKSKFPSETGFIRMKNSDIFNMSNSSG